MMNTNFREAIEWPNLRTCLHVEGTLNSLPRRERRAINNFKFCSYDYWGLVNGWYDERNEAYRERLLSPKSLFCDIYHDALENVYREGAVYFGQGASDYIRDIRFCGKDFLQKLALSFTAKLIEEAFGEVEGTESDAERITNELKELKATL